MNNPAIFLDTEGYITNYNLMAGELFFDDAHAGGYYYSNKNKLKIDLLFDIKNLENKDAFEWHYKDLIFNITSKSLHDISGKSEGLILLFNDITQLIKSEELIIIQSRQVAMGEMINMIAHQWRQPIAAISMGVNNILLDIGLESVDLEEFKLISEDILNQTQILSQIIDNFKNFFRPSKEKEQIKVEDVMLEAKNIIGKSLEDNEIKLSIHNENMKLIDTYSRELLQVFIVLLDNSKEALVEHRAHKRVIHVNISDNEDSVFIELCDNGGGIDKAIMDKIFEPYFSTKIEKNGTGLGLYIIKTIINKHMHGTIHAQNREEGVCFTVTLPLNSR
jgi:nitrogen fixation/metabolism regulation signal transduction histidine kinase